MKERPILMSAPMVRAILAGTKTQTRRVVRTDPRPQSADTFMRGFPPDPQNVRFIGAYAKCDAPDGSKSVSYRVPCPYADELGDRLWVRETFSQPGGSLHFRADDTVDHSEVFKWKPPIFMPRWASRLTLEVTMIAVERLQDITEEDAKAEGCARKIWITSPMSAGAMGAQGERGTFKDGYRDLWQEINGHGSWDVNPFVWVLDFRRL